MIIIRHWKIALPVLVILLLGGVGYLFTGGDDQVDQIEEPILKQVELITAGSLLNEGAVTTTLGTVQSTQDVILRAERSGQIVNANVQEGDVIQVGRVLMEIDRQSLDAQVLQAQARLASAQANLSKLQNGERPEDIAILEQRVAAEEQRLAELKRGTRQEELSISETQLENAQKSLEDAQRELENTKEKAARDLETTLEMSVDLIGTVASGMDKILSQNLQDIIYPIRFPNDQTCELRIQSFDEDEIKSECFDIITNSENQQFLVENLNNIELTPSFEQMLTHLQESRGKLVQLRSFLSLNLDLVNGAITMIDTASNISSGITDQELANLKSLVTSAQSENNNLINQVTGQIESIKTQQVANQNAIDTAESRVTQAENTIQSSQKDLELKQAGNTQEQIAIQESQVKQLELQLQVARQGARQEDIQAQQAAVRQAQADVAVARANQNQAIIVAPFTGTVIDFPFEVGDYVSVGDELAVIANPDQLEVITFVNEEESHYLRVGGQVTLQDGEVKGEISALSPALERDTKKREVTILVTEGAESLVIGQTVFTEFAVELPDFTLRVPLDAVKVTGTTASLYTVDQEGKIIALPVIPGDLFDDTIEVIGLTADVLIVPNITGLKEGEQVEPLYPEGKEPMSATLQTEIPTQVSPL